MIVVLFWDWRVVNLNNRNSSDMIFFHKFHNSDISTRNIAICVWTFSIVVAPRHRNCQKHGVMDILKATKYKCRFVCRLIMEFSCSWLNFQCQFCTEQRCQAVRQVIYVRWRGRHIVEQRPGKQNWHKSSLTAVGLGWKLIKAFYFIGSAPMDNDTVWRASNYWAVPVPVPRRVCRERRRRHDTWCGRCLFVRQSLLPGGHQCGPDVPFGWQNWGCDESEVHIQVQHRFLWTNNSL